MPARLLAVHAHPDDESLSMAGTLATVARAGAEVVLVTATLGEEGEVIGDEEMQGLVAARADQLGGYRLTELRAACAALGVRERAMLGGLGAFRDSGMAGTPSAEHPRAFIHAQRGGPAHDRAVAALVEVIDRVRPHVVLTYDADGGYGHPDHIAVHQVVMGALTVAGWAVPRVLGVVRPEWVTRAAFAGLPVPAGYLAAPPDEPGFLAGFLAPDDVVAVAVPTAPVDAARRAAFAAHATQVELLAGDLWALSNRIAQPLPAAEYFRLLAGRPVPRAADGTPGADVFAGLDPDREPEPEPEPEL
ncbi:N-acetyl-1-D-myo-inositol-2-amino-2-deoxy-alpha-D-glucopyranoside deacetylase [Nakamurella sp.]|uniref:N-acetyl-1-D-myo-inositol-2-amino-2-deoxy-alpha- D-glucopyranoside deacetylase n=1 Tax=Nakamurella sp. TaxID=1869182 RepID=UPI003B3AED07